MPGLRKTAWSSAMMTRILRIGGRAFVLKKSTGSEVVQAIRAAHRGGQFIDPSLTGVFISSYVGGTRSNRNKRKEVLTPREKEVCQLLAYGHANAEIADKLFIYEHPVETHRTNIMNRLDLKSRAEHAVNTGMRQASGRLILLGDGGTRSIRHRQRAAEIGWTGVRRLWI
ncbi:MAG: response regulator transcription factor [Planctomycetota bacterium]|nr:response regulator transcription factor [Planctomycetota bacterium]